MPGFVPNWASNVAILNVKDFGAVGDGLHDDTAAIQACIKAAFGSTRGVSSGQFINQAVFLPSGNYTTTAPLYLTNVSGGWIFGEGSGPSNITLLSPGTGSTLPLTSSAALSLTPVFAVDGWQYGLMENFSISGANGSSTVGVFIVQSTAALCNTTAPVFRNMLIQGVTVGILAGFGGVANCENGQLFNVQFNNCTLAGLRCVLQNTLNWQVYGGGAGQCSSASTGPGGNSGAAYSCVTGGISPIMGVSVSGNGYDFIQSGSGGMSIIGGSGESSNCVGVNTGHVVMTDFAWRPFDSLNNKFADIAGGGRLELIETFHNPGNNDGPGTFIAMGNAGIALLSGCEMAGGMAQMSITGSAGSELSLHNCTCGGVDLASSTFTGTITSYIGDNNGATSINNTVVSKLPTGVRYAGLRGSITDSSVAASGNFGLIISSAGGGGANNVPIYYDKTSSAWRLG